MANNDYQKRLDEHRKPIDEPVTATRRARHQKKIKKQSSKTPRSWFLPTLFTLGIISPIILFVYVSVFYNPLANEVPANQQVIQLDVQPVTPVQQEEEEQEEQPAEEVEEVVEQEPVEQEPVEQEPVEQEPVEEVQEPVQQPEPQQPAARTHTVQAGETLYRIAVNYYNDPSAVDRIKQANNLTSNEISTGQQLVLP